MGVYFAPSWDGFVSLAVCLGLSSISVYSAINRTSFFLSLSYFMLIMCTQSPSDELCEEQEVCGIPWCAHNEAK